MIQSGRLIMNSFRGDFEIIQKKDGSLCTSVDIQVEHLLRQGLHEINPDAGIIGEELGVQESQFAQNHDWHWVIDPLDGTKNFIHGIPHFCVMVALTYKNNPVMSAIYLPVTDDLYYAEEGKGLWLNKDRQIVYQDAVFVRKGSLVVCPQGVFAGMRTKANSKNIIISKRYFGSAGIDAIYLATGAIDFLMFENIAWWDVAPGILCIAESQGLRYAYKQDNKKTLSGDFAAGNKLFFDIFHNNHEQNL
jgi:myo-inositol-1(or 4)-monophosphatase